MISKSHVRHPAAFSDVLLPVIDGFVYPGQQKPYKLILDPFAGIGKLRKIVPDMIANEIEPEWALMSGVPGIVGDATELAFDDEVFDAVVTSPTYGNRMADSFVDHQPAKKYRRNTYTHAIGRKLHRNNSGKMQWGPKYRETHVLAWSECFRVLRYGGILVLNVSDHIRSGKRIPVSHWHKKILVNTGFDYIESKQVKTPRNGFGQNGKLRVGFEWVMLFRKEIPF